MGQISFQASNAIIYLTYGTFLVLGTAIAWSLRKKAKGMDMLASNRTQTALPLALNFNRLWKLVGNVTGSDFSCRFSDTNPIRSLSRNLRQRGVDKVPNQLVDQLGAVHKVALGSGILFSYPQLAVISGVQGVLVYAFASALPLFVFASLGPIIRRKCPEGFVLTEWTRQRYGIPAAIFLGFVTLATIFLYMVSELSAIGQVVNALTGLDILPPMIVQAVVTTIYTAMGGFRISFITDNVQGVMVLGLVLIATITIGAKTDIDRSLIEESGLTKANLLGWQLIYIMPVAVLTNDFFLSHFWLRTFASRTDRDLWIGVSMATVAILIILTLVGCAGLVAVWSGAWPGPGNDPATTDGSVAFFLLLELLPSWVVGIVLVMSVSLSTAAFDSLQSSMVSSASNDIFRNRLPTIYIRIMVALIIIPVIVVAVRSPNILQIYLISDLISATTIPVLVIGLSERCNAWSGTDVVVGALGGLLTVFIYGAIYYDDAYKGAQLLLLEQGLYEGDWGAFGAFVAAPVGGLLFGLASFLLRMGFLYIRSRQTGLPFDPTDKHIGREGNGARGTTVAVEREPELLSNEPVLDQEGTLVHRSSRPSDAKNVAL